MDYMIRHMHVILQFFKNCNTDFQRMSYICDLKQDIYCRFQALYDAREKCYVPYYFGHAYI